MDDPLSICALCPFFAFHSFMLHFLRVTLFLCSTFFVFHAASFPCCTFLYSNLFMLQFFTLHNFGVVPFPCSTFFILHRFYFVFFFVWHSFYVLHYFMLHFYTFQCFLFAFALFSCYTLFMLHCFRSYSQDLLKHLQWELCNSN